MVICACKATTGSVDGKTIHYKVTPRLSGRRSRTAQACCWTRQLHRYSKPMKLSFDLSPAHWLCHHVNPDVRPDPHPLREQTCREIERHHRGVDMAYGPSSRRC